MPDLPHAPAARPLVVTADPDLLEDLLRIAAAAGTDLHVEPDPAGARSAWDSTPLVVVGDDQADACGRAGLRRRSGVVLLGADLDDAGVWQRGVTLGAEHVVFLPDAQTWLRDRFADAVDGSGEDAALVAVVGGRGGAGATTFACGLAVTAARQGRSSMLIDGDPLGGGIDLVFGGEHDHGLRWPDLGGSRGRLPSGALASALPRMNELTVLSWDRGHELVVPVEAMQAVLASGRRSHDLVVVDTPRGLTECARAVLRVADLVVLVVPAEVRAAAAAGRIAASVCGLAGDLRLVVRGPSPRGLGADELAAALGLPLLAEMRSEPGIDVALDRGDAPARTGRGPLAQACEQVLGALGSRHRRAA